MKCEVSPLVQLERKELETLCTQVKETIATDVRFPAKKSSYSIADLWYARKSMNTAGKRWNNRPVIFSRL
jgi:hypothetical protein